MKIGLLAYSTNTGLGIQTYEFYKHMNPAKVLVSDLSIYNKMKTHHDWYEGNVTVVKGIPTNQAMEWLVNDMDVVFVAETPLNYHLFKYAKLKNVLVVQQPNPEFLDYYKKPQLSKPHVLALPSPWKENEIRNLNIAKTEVLRVPVNTNNIPTRDIKEVKTIIHILGRPAVHDRNGTLSFIDLVNRLQSNYKYIVYMQDPKDNRAKEYFDPIKRRLDKTPQIQIKKNLPNYTDLYKDGDLLVLPRRYGGLCLPQQEALAAGIPVIMTDIPPNNTLLPKEWLVDATPISEFKGHTTNIVYSANIDGLQNVVKNATLNIASNTRIANDIAKSISWKNMREVYLKSFQKWIKELLS